MGLDKGSFFKFSTFMKTQFGFIATGCLAMVINRMYKCWWVKTCFFTSDIVTISGLSSKCFFVSGKVNNSSGDNNVLVSINGRSYILAQISPSPRLFISILSPSENKK